jgi:hypothetical protein
VRLFRASDLTKLDEFTQAKKEFTTSKFLPFRSALSPGAVILPMNSPSLIYLAVEEAKQKGLGEVDWQLKFAKKKAELAGP